MRIIYGTILLTEINRKIVPLFCIRKRCVLKKYIKELILWGIAVSLAGAILLAGSWEEKKESVYDIVFLGDSVVGNVTGEITITGILEQRLGKTVYNGALGGTCMSFDNDKVWESLNVPQWSMVKLAQAMYAQDWTSQLAAVTYAEKYRSVNMTVLDYFYPRIRGLSEIDFSKVEILLIGHGTNDYNCGQLLESAENPMDVTTFAGALRTGLSLLREKYPELRIILVSPTYCEIQTDTFEKCYEVDFGGGTLDQYVEMERQIAAEYDVEWIDLYHGSGIREDNIDRYLYDKLHPNEEGTQLLGNLIADYLEKNNK